jgi:hypothetical protein
MKLNSLKMVLLNDLKQLKDKAEDFAGRLKK